MEETITSYIESLNKWEIDIKQKDKLCSQKSKLEKILPPIRNTKEEIPTINLETNKTKEMPQVNKFQELKKNVENNPSTDLALKLKEKGNKLYSEGKYLEAIDFYTKAINIDSSNSTFWGNRALCYFLLQDSNKCERDCNMAISLDPSNIKLYLRRGHARKALQKNEQALEDFNHVLKTETKNKDALQQVEIIRNLLKPQPKIVPIESKNIVNNTNNTTSKKDSNNKDDKNKNNVLHLNKTNNTNNNNNVVNDKNNVVNKNILTNNSPKSEPISIQKQIDNTTSTPTEKTTTQKFLLSEKNLNTNKPLLITENKTVENKNDLNNNSNISNDKILNTSSNNNNNNKIKPNIQFSLNLVAPNSYFDFSQTFSSIKKDDKMLYDYFCLVDPKNLVSLFKSSFTDEHLVSFVRVFHKFFVPQKQFDTIFQFLTHFLKIDRFDMTFMFLDEKDKKSLFSLFDLLQNIDSNLLNTLKKKYSTL